jgi:hypothetical protein
MATFTKTFNNFASSEIAQVAVKPHQHDCERCIFMGQSSENDQQVDLYYCRKNRDGGDLIMRYSDEGGDYRSMNYEQVMEFKPSTYMPLYRLVRSHKRHGAFDKMIKLYRQ